MMRTAFCHSKSRHLIHELHYANTYISPPAIPFKQHVVFNNTNWLDVCVLCMRACTVYSLQGVDKNLFT